MDARTTGAVLAYINQLDARFQVNESVIRLWSAALGSISPDAVKNAVDRHYSLNAQTVTLSDVKRASREVQETVEAAARAALPPAPSQSRMRKVLRSSDPARWDELFRQGRVEGAVDRARNQAKLEHRPRDAAEAWARDWIGSRIDAEAAGAPGTVPRFMPWPPTNY